MDPTAKCAKEEPLIDVRCFNLRSTVAENQALVMRLYGIIEEKDIPEDGPAAPTPFTIADTLEEINNTVIDTNKMLSEIIMRLEGQIGRIKILAKRNKAGQRKT